MLNFIAGQDYFRPMLDVAPEAYPGVVKATLKFILVPAFSTETEADRAS